jgi:hypothetical protein
MSHELSDTTEDRPQPRRRGNIRNLVGLLNPEGREYTDEEVDRMLEEAREERLSRYLLPGETFESLAAKLNASNHEEQPRSLSSDRGMKG